MAALDARFRCEALAPFRHGLERTAGGRDRDAWSWLPPGLALGGGGYTSICGLSSLGGSRYCMIAPGLAIFGTSATVHTHGRALSQKPWRLGGSSPRCAAVPRRRLKTSGWRGD